MEEPIKAERATVEFFDGLTVDGYRMPDGEFRIGLAGASRILGYSDRWLRDAVTGETPRTAKALEGIGFSENIEKVLGQSNQGNQFEDTTINLDDFNCCIIYGVQAKRKAAIALQKSFTKLALNDFFRDAFGEPPLSIEQKRDLFYKTYAASISPEDWRTMDKQEILRLALPGDEPHLRRGKWNSWSDDI
ncbi:hypothetical protein Cri9333_5003 (plasmid) [Crinalium epipsammum PCC 9333]|uniref:Uncharacterized protein n=1 Tax=Crinalium epipsammum PCC 9333 TaxID=1173022 RepID=K9W5Y6_9CYAN|nr:hypothetical protein [Crinalium epipsammum]AFZ15758.1 hypothetical protein Cri9333_5003 [Crinalium epipsammum PCC 9333]